MDSTKPNPKMYREQQVVSLSGTNCPPPSPQPNNDDTYLPSAPPLREISQATYPPSSFGTNQLHGTSNQPIAPKVNLGTKPFMPTNAAYPPETGTPQNKSFISTLRNFFSWKESQTDTTTWNPFKLGEQYDLHNGPLKRTSRTNSGMLWIFPFCFLLYLITCGISLYLGTKPIVEVIKYRNRFKTRYLDHKGRRCGFDMEVIDYPYLYFPPKTMYDFPSDFGDSTPVCTNTCPLFYSRHRIGSCPPDSEHYCNWLYDEPSSLDEENLRCLHPEQVDANIRVFDSRETRYTPKISVLHTFFAFRMMLLIILLVSIISSILFSFLGRIEYIKRNYGINLAIISLIAFVIICYLAIIEDGLKAVLVVIGLIIALPVIIIIFRFLFRPRNWNLLAIEKIAKLTNSFNTKFPLFRLIPLFFTSMLLIVFVFSMAALSAIDGAGNAYGLRNSSQFLRDLFQIIIIFMTIWMGLIFYHMSALLMGYQIGDYYFSMKYGASNKNGWMDTMRLLYLNHLGSIFYGSFISMILFIPRLLMKIVHHIVHPIKAIGYAKGTKAMSRHHVFSLYHSLTFSMMALIGKNFSECERAAFSLARRQKLCLFAMRKSLGAPFLRFATVAICGAILLFIVRFCFPIEVEGNIIIFFFCFFGISYVLSSFLHQSDEVIPDVFWLCYIIDQELNKGNPLPISTTISPILADLHALKPQIL